MAASDQPSPEERGTWMEGRDILESNMPRGGPPFAAPASVSSSPTSRRKTPPWSLIVGVPVLIVILLVVGVLVRAQMLGVFGHGAPGTASAASGAASQNVHVMSNVGGDPLVSARVDPTPPIPKSPVAYLEAQSKGDGTAAWDQLSAGAQQQIAQQGGSAAALTQELQQNPLPPVKQITFVGGAIMNDGREAAIFVVTADVNGSLREVPYYFTVDTQGKIDEVH